MTTEGINRRLTAILSADVEGYSRLMSQDEVGTIRTLTAYREAITTLIQQYKGRVVDAPGDNLLAEFASVMNAVNCAVEIQRDLAERNAETPSTRVMRFRIGINLGDVIEEEGRIYGDGVNITARIESLAEAGGICVSGSVHDAIENKIGFQFKYLGEQEVKNIAQPVRVYRVLSLPGAVAPIEADSEEGMAFPLPDKPSIAVLPFTNMSGDPEQEYFVDGMTDDLITDLSKISGLFVIARNSVFTYKDKPIKIKQVSRELGVRYVLEGSVRKVGDKVRINAQLIDATIADHLWAERYDDNLSDVFAMQDRITQKIVSALSIKLTANEQERVTRKDTDNLEAYDFFLRGKQVYYSLSSDRIDEALSMFSKAIELDPQFALASAFHARTNWHKSMLVPESRGESLTEASKYAKKALVLDNTLPEARTVLSLLQHNDGLHDEAIASAAKAVTMDYNNAESYLYQAYVLSFAGKHDEAFDSINVAFRLNPNPPSLYYYGLTRIQLNRRQYIEALHNLKQAPESFIVTFELKVPVFAYAGLLEEARNELKNILKIYPNYSLSAIRKNSKYKLKEDVEHHLEGFRMAGLQR